MYFIFYVEIRMMVKNVGAPPRDTIKVIEKKLEICRNQANNPDSDMYGSHHYSETFIKYNNLLFCNISDTSKECGK